ncbi:ATP-dependent DNA helicase DinG [Bacillus sp. FJAT-49736]|uniref:ATP-dependent DNA helicase DinG n=1 Tax=Bacillus sp. FJAT-49736 TaxID=2833582 RepID=UPI001BC91CE5|nr:ATP-dependent DNA helicase DinG [Bacillus sp. FJAT-49736]MBS4173247.1 ATP-dependent DNA helicase DinG [Bacillus sp. FJAT-49736]
MDQKFVVVDIETTGNSPKKGERIIQISAVKIENEKIIDQYTTFVNPEILIPPFIEELTGINDHMVMNAPLFEEIAPTLREYLEGYIFVAHNVLFDLPFLQNEFERVGVQPFLGMTIDTVELAKIILPTADSYKLAELAESLSLSHERPHQADSDAIVTAELLLYLLRKAKRLPLVTLEKLADFSIHLKSNIDSLFHNILSEKRNHIEDLPHDIEVYRGIALKKKLNSVKVDHYREKPIYPKTADEKEKIISSYIKSYERRAGQFEMMDIVYDSFQNEKVAIVEAGTGTGKSIGYLLPSIYFAYTKKSPVVISTYTVQLQEQLMRKEIRILSNILPFSFKTVLLKGRNHYLNMFKFEQSLLERDFQYDSLLTKMQILVWLTETVSGDIDELNLSSGGILLWNRIKHNDWHLTKEKNPWVSRDFYLFAKKSALDADIIITNHAMLFTELAQDVKIFPDFSYLVIDEAHHLEHAARQHLSIKLEYIACKFLLSRLGIYEKKQLYFRLEKLVEKHGITVENHVFEIDFMIQELEFALDELFMMFGKFIQSVSKKEQLQPKVKIRLKKDILQGNGWNAVLLGAEQINALMIDVQKGIQERLESLNKESEKLNNKDKAIIEEMYGLMSDFEQLRISIIALLLHPLDHYVYWMEGDKRALPNSIIIQAQPVTVQMQLNEKLFEKMKSVFLTSATLSINQSFHYFKEAVGLNLMSNVIEKQIPSPYDFHKLTKLIIPNDIPEIQQVSLQEYAEVITNHLIGIAQATKGRMLVLFTSYELLRMAHDYMRSSGLLEEFVLIAQGITSGSRTRLTKNFQRFDKSILFGTSSFWEGVDIPGEDLSCLVIVRLPFSPPDDPITEAINEFYKQSGKNSFTAHSLPEAIIRFKQGFGRLIRRSTDKGVVIVFDRRIETTSYGKAFIKSIPAVQMEHGNLSEIIDKIEKWL